MKRRILTTHVGDLITHSAQPKLAFTVRGNWSGARRFRCACRKARRVGRLSLRDASAPGRNASDPSV